MAPLPAFRTACAITLVAAATACAGMEEESVPALAELDSLVLVEELRVGSLENPDLGFTSIGPIRVEPSGEMFVQESGDQQIRLYGPDGQLIRKYGREGDGPGEFRTIYGFGLLGDTLWVSDGRLRRLTLFDRSGTLLHTVSGSVEVPLAPADTPGFGRRVITVFPNSLGPNGEFIGLPSVVRYPNLPDSIVDLPHVLFGADGEVLDTVELVPTVVSFPSRILTFPSRDGRGRTSSSLRIEPPATDSGRYGPEAIAEGDSVTLSWAVAGSPPLGTVELTRTRAGQEVFRTRVRYTPRPVDPAYLDSIANARPRGLQLAPADSAELAETARSILQMPPHHQPVFGWYVRGNGTSWTRLDEIEADVDRWLVVAPDGDVRGVAALPARAQVRWHDDERVWVVERDEFDVSWLVRYRLGEP
jgi:hypothetical protein